MQRACPVVWLRKLTQIRRNSIFAPALFTGQEMFLASTRALHILQGGGRPCWRLPCLEPTKSRSLTGEDKDSGWAPQRFLFLVRTLKLSFLLRCVEFLPQVASRTSKGSGSSQRFFCLGTVQFWVSRLLSNLIGILLTVALRNRLPNIFQRNQKCHCSK